MSRSVRVPPELVSGPFTRAVGLEHLTVKQLRHPTYTRLTSGVYVATSNLTHGDKIRGARLTLPGDAVLVGRSALWALGVHLAAAADRVEVQVRPDSRIRRGDLLRITRGTIDARETVLTPWGLTTTPARTAFDLARREGELVSVPLIDALVRATGVPRSSIDAVTRAHPGARGVRRVRSALDLVDPGAESVRESLLRLHIVRAGLPPPQTQIRVCNAEGEFVARIDMGWVTCKVAIEYDGAHHDDPRQIAKDRARLNALRAAGWTVIVIDRAQLAHPQDVVELVRRVLDAAQH